MDAVAPLCALPFRLADEAPDRRVVVDGERSLDAADFAGAVRRCAGMLQAAGVSRGDVVATMLPNCAELLVVMFAAWHRGAALTPINPELTDDEMCYQLDDSSAVVLVDDGRGRERAAETGIGWIDVGSVLGEVPPSAGIAAVARPVGELSDFALVIYVTGSNGKSCGVLLDHRNLEAMSSTMSEALALGSADTSLLLLPLFHVNGIVISVLSALRVGADVVIAPRFSPDTFWELAARHRPTYFSAVPTIYALLEARSGEGRDAGCFRFGVCGAAPLPVELLARFEEHFAIPVVEGYGLTECTVAATLNPVSGERRPGSVGVALPGQEVAIVDALGVLQPQGARGEVVVRGPHVFRGYLGQPEETAKVIRDGWLHTGEVGELDSDGYLVLVDRIKDVIRRGGVEIHPREVEEALSQHPAVLEAAVVGRPDPVLGEVPVAYVSAKPGLVVTSDELRTHLQTNLARFKRPTEIHVHAQLPRNAVGKLVKAMLADLTPTC